MKIDRLLLLIVSLVCMIKTSLGGTVFSGYSLDNRRYYPVNKTVPALPDIVIVKITDNDLMKGSNVSWEKNLKKINAISIEPMFPKSRVHSTGLSKIYKIQLMPGGNVYKAIEVLSKEPSVLWAEPLYLRKIHYDPDDPFIFSQWYLNKIEVMAAWDVFKDNEEIIIGIVDTGIDMQHPDLAANLWINSREIPNNGIDDDDNGYVDDLKGWDFGNDDNDPSPTTDETISDRWHGTGVAGVASAVTNNNIGIAAPAFNAKIMCIKAAQDDNEEQYILYGYHGIQYAADNGADVINCSFGGAGASNYEQEVVAHACSLGVLVVASAGNENSDLPQYPANYPGVLSVAATNESEIKSLFSNYGYWVDISAPGSQIYTTWGKNDYRMVSGTSFSSPLAASVAALLKGFNPGWTGDQIKEQIRVSTDPIDGLNPNYNRKLGRGRLNAHRALTVNSPSIRLTNFDLVEGEDSNRDGIFDPGEEILITFRIKNFLQPVSGILLNFETENPDVLIQNGFFIIPSLNTSEEWVNDGNPVKVQISSSASRGQTVDIALNILTDGGYIDFDYINLEISLTYATIQGANVRLTVTSIGRLGYIDYPDNQRGEGFVFGDAGNILFEGAVMAAAAPDSVSDAARGADQSRQNEDFAATSDGEIFIQRPGNLADEQGTAIFTDENVSESLNIQLFQTCLAFSDSINGDYIILAFRIYNLSTDTLKNLFFGIFMDWDIGEASENRPGFDPDLSLGYVYEENSLIHGGLQVVSEGGVTGYKSINNPDEIYDGYTDEEKWLHLSGGIQNINGSDPDDYSNVLSVGPMTLIPEDTLMVGFAVLGGLGLNKLKENAITAKSKWKELFEGADSVNEEINPPLIYRLEKNYPNPFNSGTTIGYYLPKRSYAVLIVHNLMGREVARLVDKEQDSGNYEINWEGQTINGLAASGIYFYRLKAGNFIRVRKMVLIR